MSNNGNTTFPIITPYTHQQVTQAPPIPTYYKTGMTSVYSSFPPISIPQNPKNIAKSFSDKYKELQAIEDKLQNGGSNQPQPNLPIIEEVRSECTDKLNNKLTNNFVSQKDDTLLKSQLEAMKQLKSPLPESKYEIEKKEAAAKQKEILDIYSKQGEKQFKAQLLASLSEYSKSIQDQIKEEQMKSIEYVKVIKSTMDEVKNGLFKEIELFEKNSNDSLKDMKKIMLKAPNSRMRFLVKNILGKGEDIEAEEDKHETRVRNMRNSAKRMSVLVSQGADLSKIENEKEKEKQIKSQYEMIQESLKDMNKKRDMGLDSSKEIDLDFWQKNRKEQLKIHEEISSQVDSVTPQLDNMSPISKFRSYVITVISARRLLNIRYNTYKNIKITVVKQFINDYNDIDSLIRKLIYSSIKDTMYELISDKAPNLNMIVEQPDRHDTFLKLKDVLEKMLNSLTEKFFSGVSDNVLGFLSLLISNYSYIPRSFFTTFELVRIRMTKTGDLIDMETEQQRMILCFYLILKILIKNVLLEMEFNQDTMHSLSRECKLNIKMIVSVLYRGLIEEMVKDCFTKTNLEDLEEEENIKNFMTIPYMKKEFTLKSTLQRNKKLFLKDSDEEEIQITDKSRLRKRRLEERGRLQSGERSGTRRRNQVFSVQSKKFRPQEEEEEEEEQPVSPIRRRKPRNAEEPKKKKKKIKRQETEETVDNLRAVPKGKESGDEQKSSRKRSKSSKSKVSKATKKTGSKRSSSKSKKKKKKEGEEKSEKIEDSEMPQSETGVIKSKKSRKKKSKEKKAARAPPKQEIEPPSRPDEPKKKSKSKSKSKSKKKKKSKKEEEENVEEESTKKKKKTKKSKKEKSSKSRSKSKKSQGISEDEEQSKLTNIKVQKPKKSKKLKESEDNEDKKSTKKKKKSKSKSKSKAKKEKDDSKSKRSKTSKKSKRSKKSKKSKRSKKSKEAEEEKTEQSPKAQKESGKTSQLSPEGRTEKEVGEQNSMAALNDQNIIPYKGAIETSKFKSDFTKPEIREMLSIIENLQNFGDDSQPNEIEFIDSILYKNENLETYYLFAEEYGFDPITIINDFIEKLLNMITENFNK